MATGHVKTFRSQKYKIKTTKPVPVSRLEKELNSSNV